MTAAKSIGLTFLIIVLILFFSSIYSVNEGHQACLLRLGKLVQQPGSNLVEIMQPGLHLKWPVIEKVKVFDTRLQTFDSQATRILTAEKSDVSMDYYVRWRITNLPLYYTRTSGNNEQTIVLLQEQINDSMRTKFGQLTFSEIVAQANSTIMPSILIKANEKANTLGLQIVDMKIIRIDSPAVVKNALEQMRAAQERLASKYRSEGKAKAETIRTVADGNVTVSLAQASAEAAKIRAQGDATASKIYSDAYTQDPSFFAFYRSITAYKNAFNGKDDLIVLRPQGQFFKYFTSAGSSSNSNSSAPSS
jgi:membrane protease subunit HflC